MPAKRAVTLAAFGIAWLATWSPAPAGAAVSLEKLADVSSPTYAFHAGDERLFVLERTGKIWIHRPGVGLLPTPFLDIQSKVMTEGERGLFAIAFPPDFAATGTFFVSYFGNQPVTGNVVARYQVSAGDPDVADSSTETIVFSLQQPSGQHNAGQIAFGPDGYLYLSIGDGGGSNDQACHAQRGDVLLGKLLRLDVTQNAGQPPYHGIPPDNPFTGANDPLDQVRDEIWALGLRNPWRFSFDSLTGDLFIGDVGQDGREEIDYQPAGHPGGLNYGWKLMEGFQCKNPAAGSCPVGTPPCFDPAYTNPLVDIPHSETCAVMGGFVYRGSAIPELAGKYLFGDFCSGRIWSIEEIAPGLWGHRQTVLVGERWLRSFGQDADGELYALAGNGLFRLVSAASLARPQSTAQQACLNNMNQRGAELVRTRGKLDAECVKLASRRRLGTLGLPPAEQTLAHCLSADTRSRIARRVDALRVREERKCRVAGRPDLLPDFGFTSSARVAGAAGSAANRLTRSLLGEDPDAGLIFEADDSAGALCQRQVVQLSQTLLDALWKIAIEGKKGHLRGRLGPAVKSAGELGAAVLGFVDQAVASGRVTVRRQQLARAVSRSCDGEPDATPYDALLPGVCASASDADAVAGCALEQARCAFCRSFESFDGLSLDCDAFDDGIADGSCPSEAEVVCSQPGAGVNFAAADFDCPTLAGYRLFENPADPRRDPNGDGLPFDLTTPLFSDYAQKYRFVFLPPGEAALYDPATPFSFPVGTILAKTFSFADDLRDVSLGEHLVETRLLIHRSFGWEGLVYVWDQPSGTAHLSVDGGSYAASWIHFDGTPRATVYEIPTPVQCAECHTRPLASGTAPIGPTARLLNRLLDYPGGAANQIDRWSAVGALLGAPPSGTAPRLPFWDDPLDGSVAERAIAYLETNCAPCLNPDGKAGFTNLDLRHHVPVGPARGVCQSSGFGGIPGLTHNIVPGSPLESILRLRASSASPGLRMPEMLKSIVHEEGVALLDQWISSLPGSCD